MFYSMDKTTSPFKYYLCRNDKNTKDRHCKNVHNTMDSSDVLFVRTDALEAKEAMSCYEAACVKNNKDQIPAGHQVATCQLQNSDSGTAIQETASMNISRAHDFNILEQSCDNQSESVKLDTIIDMLKHMLPKVEQQQPNPPSSDISVLVKELSVDGKGEIEWCSVNNIIELIEAMPDIQFFAGQEGIRNGCVRCKICFDYLCNQDNSLKKSDPLVNEDNGHIAKAHIKK